ncbi:MAG TPA: hypothetical protein VNV82_10780 [Bryobacteraceae bacterium]|jgi:hypothetical protein|nr:hypothetical protein [Bryobacteraceae bacterium]
MAQHVKVLGVLHIIYGSLLVMVGLVVFLILGGIAGLVGATDHSPDSAVAIPILGGIGGLVFVILLAISLPGIVAGIGLVQFRPWARILTLILSALELFSIPIGTALGIYGFWVLLKPETEQLFNQPPPLSMTPRV